MTWPRGAGTYIIYNSLQRYEFLAISLRGDFKFSLSLFNPHCDGSMNVRRRGDECTESPGGSDVKKRNTMLDFLAQYNLTGLLIGAATFLIIGLFHPLVIKGEYYFGVKLWWVFLLMGLGAVAASVAVRHVVWSTLLAVWGASSLWSIGELFEQRKRVARGWFPRNPRRNP